MSKKIRLVPAVFAVFSLLVTSVLVASRATAQRQGANVASSSAKSAAIVATTAAVLKETSEIRELPVLRPVKSGAQSRTDIERMVVRNLNEQTTAADMHATEAALRKLGLVPLDFQYRSFVIKLLTEQVAGYYDPKLQEFFLADWIDLEAQKPVMAHELTHALQDQHFNLRRFEHWPKGDADAELAAHALIEGDAVVSMTIYMARNPLVALAFARSMGTNSSTSSDQFKQAPRALRESLVFPYQEGAEWATAVFKRGGWKMVSTAFTELPQSTEQVLHPEKYFAHEATVRVNLPDVHALLGPRWKRIDYDVNGEWSYYLILDQFLNSAPESKRASAGWGGDRYAIYEGKPGEVLITQLTVWDTENDAREFFVAYAKRTGSRYADAKRSEPVRSAAGARQTWSTSEGGVVVELRGKRVLILEGVPEGMDSQHLLKTFWQ